MSGIAKSKLLNCPGSLAAFTLLAAISFFYLTVLTSFAQSYNDNADPTRANITFSPPQGNPTQGMLPPPGSVNPGGSNPRAGAIAPPVTQGDQPGTNPPVPTGTATSNPINGTYFQHQTLSPRSRVNLLVSGPRGTRVALTFQPDQLTASQKGAIQGQLGLGAGGLANQPYQNIKATQPQIEKIQKILFPPAGTKDGSRFYSGTPGNNLPGSPANPLGIFHPTSKYISADSPGITPPRYTSSAVANARLNPRQPIRSFCRYLVKKGVVVACIELILASALIIYGHQHAGNKAIVAAGGLILLLMAYSIWKVDLFNNLNARGRGQAVDLAGNIKDGSQPDSFDLDLDQGALTDPDAQVLGKHTYTGDNTLGSDMKTAQAGGGGRPTANTPVVPASTSTVQRAGLPLSPLGAAH